MPKTKKKSNEMMTAVEDGKLTVLIETPRNSRNKYKYDSKSRKLQFEATLKGGLTYPFDFGFVPDTLAEDGDPLDVIIFMDQFCAPGCTIEVRLIGVLEAVQTEPNRSIRNDRLLAVHAHSVFFANFKDWSELPSNVCEDISLFFKFSNMTKGREFKVLGWRGPKEAESLLRKAQKKFCKKQVT